MNRIAHWLGAVVAWLFIASVLITAYDVIMRYAFTRPTAWAQEVTILLNAIAFIVGGLYVTARGEHISITIFSDRYGRTARRLLALLTAMLGALFLGAIAWGGRRDAWEALTQWQRTATAADTPTPAIVKPLLCAIALAMVVQLCVNLMRRRGRDE
jgi:TRAP-type C4-dicarboxylate transport system permease small subunit